MKNMYNHNAVREAQLEQNLDARLNAPAAEPLKAPALPAHLRVRTHQELLKPELASDEELIRRLSVLADADPRGECPEVVAMFNAVAAEFDKRHPEALDAERKALRAILTKSVHKHAPQGGAYKRGQHYRPGDIVVHNGRQYRCRVNYASVDAADDPHCNPARWQPL
ncbi:MAG TPA: carbohydrate-binding protein [Casimicrobiaceae bacterium]